MKKLKSILALSLAAALCVCLLPGCTSEKEPDESAPSVETTDNAEETVKITDGIFVCASNPTHRQLIKFKEDGTFYAQGLTQQRAITGTYEVVDMEVEYIYCGADGLWSNHEEGSDDGDPSVQKSTQAVKFYESDGVTPFDIRGELEGVEFQNDGIETNVIAYAEGKLHHVSIDGYIRTLTQNAADTFSVADEIKNLLYTFMPETLPDWAAAGGYGQSELKLELYHNSWEDLATSEELASGGYTSIEGNVFTLDSGAVITVAEDGKSATYVDGDTTINMVEWADIQIAAKLTGTATVSLSSGPMENEAAITLYSNGSANFAAGSMNENFTYSVDGTALVFDWEAFTLDSSSYNAASGEVSAKLSGTMNGMSVTVDVSGTAEAKLYGDNTVTKLLSTGEGSLMGGKITANAVFYSDGTMEIIANGSTTLAHARWQLNVEAHKVEFSNVSGGTLEFALAQEATVTWTGIVSEQIADEQTISMSFPNTELANLQNAAPTVLLTTGEASLVGGKIITTATFYSDGTVSVSGSSGSGAAELATAVWEFSQNEKGIPSIEFANVSSGTMDFAMSSERGAGVLTWVGSVNPQMEDQTAEMSTPIADFVALKWA